MGVSVCVQTTIDDSTCTSVFLHRLTWQRHLSGRVPCRDTEKPAVLHWCLWTRISSLLLRPSRISSLLLRPSRIYGLLLRPSRISSLLLRPSRIYGLLLRSDIRPHVQSGITGLHVRVSVPIEPIHEVSRTLSLERLDIISNGDCPCWEFLATLSNLTTNYASISDRLCRYHQDYYQRRSKTDHDCSCHTNPKPHFCTDCGHCHECGCDLCTTSPANFHRCSCPLCLNRCCGLLGPDPKHLELTQRRHRLLRLKQSIAACASTSRHGHPPPTLDRALAELRLEPARAEFISTGLRSPPLTRQTA